MRKRVERRWAITIVVRFRISVSRLSWMILSVRESRAEVASSKMRIGASTKMARAIAHGGIGLLCQPKRLEEGGERRADGPHDDSEVPHRLEYLDDLACRNLVVEP